MPRIASLVFAALVLGAAAGRAQERPVQEPPPQDAPAPPPPTTVEPILPPDRIMVVVGDDILLLSEWRDQTSILAQQLGVEPTDPTFAGLAEQIYDQLVRDLVILAAAERDTMIRVSDDEVLEQTEAELAEVRRRFASEEEFQAQLARSQWGSLAAYRADIQERKRRELLGQMYIEIHRHEIRVQPVTDEEVRVFWEANREQLGMTPIVVRFEEIPVTVQPSEEARARARAEAERIKAEIEGGLDFATAARQVSDDASNRDEGGVLGWFGRGRMVEPFERAAFEAPIGQITGPVETPFGMHILQVLDRREDEVSVRHVLVAYEFTDEDRSRARAEAERIQGLVSAGAEVDSLQAEIVRGDSAAAAVLEVARDRLPEAYARTLQGLEPGRAAVVETPTGSSVVVARGTGGGEPYTFEQAAPRIRQQLTQQKAEEAFVERLREQVYVDIRLRPSDVMGRG